MSARTLGGSVAFTVSPEEAFDYLVEPAHRAEWQSSLREVDEVHGPVGEGQSWTDVTRPGLRPRMTTTTFRRPHEWAETGTWRGVAADLTLRFVPDGSGCTVEYRFRIRFLGPLGLLATLVSVPPVRADLRKAAKILASRGS